MTQEDFLEFGGTSWEELTEMANIVLSSVDESPEPVATTDPETGEGFCDLGSYNWGDPEQEAEEEGSYPCENHFPIVHVQGDAQITGGGIGQGILLVDGDIEIGGGFNFYGIVVAQGSFETSGGSGSGNRVIGGVMAAGAELGDDDYQEYVGSSVIQASQCVQERARSMAQANRPVALEGRSWADITASGY